MQNASFPTVSVPAASMGGLNVPGQGGVILPNGQVALVRETATACSHSVQTHFACMPPQRSKILTPHLELLRSHRVRFLETCCPDGDRCNGGLWGQCGERRHVNGRCGVVFKASVIDSLLHMRLSGVLLSCRCLRWQTWDSTRPATPCPWAEMWCSHRPSSTAEAPTAGRACPCTHLHTWLPRRPMQLR